MLDYVIFGASALGETVYNDIKDRYRIRAFCDNDRHKQGSIFCGKKVISPNELLDEPVHVIVASIFAIEIIKQLFDIGIKKVTMEYAHDYREIDLSGFESLDEIPNKVCVVVKHNSGSNSYALLKLSTDPNILLVQVNDTLKDANFYYHMITCALVVTTHLENFPGKRILELWHSLPFKALGYTIYDESLRYGVDMAHRKCVARQAVCTYSELSSMILGYSYYVKPDYFVITGSPRNDFLFVSDGRSKLISLLKLNASENTKIVLYAPTFRKSKAWGENGADDAFIFNMSDKEMNVFNIFLQENNIFFIMKMHPYDLSNVPGYGYSHIKIIDAELLETGHVDFYELLNGFDALITDYSSIYIDFLLTDCPVIFTPWDLEEYRQTRGLTLEPYDEWTPGEKAYTIEELKQALMSSLYGNDQYKEHRRLIKNMMHKYRDGNSTGRVTELIKKLTNTTEGNR